jgi:hypothetical protein
MHLCGGGAAEVGCGVGESERQLLPGRRLVLRIGCMYAIKIKIRFVKCKNHKIKLQIQEKMSIHAVSRTSKRSKSDSEHCLKCNFNSIFTLWK